MPALPHESEKLCDLVLITKAQHMVVPMADTCQRVAYVEKELVGILILDGRTFCEPGGHKCLDEDAVTQPARGFFNIALDKVGEATKPAATFGLILGDFIEAKPCARTPVRENCGGCFLHQRAVSRNPTDIQQPQGGFEVRLRYTATLFE